MKFSIRIKTLSSVAGHFALAALTACGASSPSSPVAPALYTCTPAASSNSFPGALATGTNVVNVTINGSTCTGAPSYQNEPCVAVTICDSTAACITFNDILVDTGSYGLRIFKQALTNAPGNAGFYGNLVAAQENAGLGKLAECVVFGDLSSEFGPVVTAKITMGTEVANSVPIMIIDSTYSGGAAGTPCSAAQSKPDTAPSTTGFNGILGVGVFQYDGGNYYSCLNNACSSTSVATITPSLQVQNPVASFAVNNNGVILTFPGIPANGAASVDGYLIFGINTAANNASTNVKGYKADANAEIQTVFGVAPTGTVLPSFIDSGSNAYYFPSPSPYVTPDCGNGFFCPPSILTLTALNKDKNGANANCVSLQVANTNALLSDPTKLVFNDLAGNAGSGINGLFDFGLPFFLGREIFVGISGKTSFGLTNAASGPYFGY